MLATESAPLLEPISAWLPENVHPIWASAAIVGVMIVLALVAHVVIYFILTQVTRKTPGVADASLVKHTKAPARFVLILLAILLVVPSLPVAVEEAARQLIRHVLSLGLIVSITWLVIRGLGAIDDVILARYDLQVSDNLLARKVHTQTKVLSRTVMIVVGVIGVAAALMTFPSIRQLGASLLASAGLAGLVVGLAARPTLGNLVAGLQIALTQPIRLDDVVIVEGEWGRIEEITATYVVVRIWDQRRLIVPLEHFINNPFQNWTRISADILGTIFIYADYTVPVDAVRRELERIVKDHEKWDGRLCLLQITDTTERTMQMRALVSAADSGAAWDLRCHVREKMIEFLQREYPDSLPRVRAEMDGEVRVGDGEPHERESGPA